MTPYMLIFVLGLKVLIDLVAAVLFAVKREWAMFFLFVGFAVADCAALWMAKPT